MASLLVPSLAVSTARPGALRIFSVKLTRNPPGGLRLPALVAFTGVSAGTNMPSLEPFRTVQLEGTAPGGVWTQVSGPLVTLVGSGARVSYVAPAAAAAVTRRFTYTVAGLSASVDHTVLQATEFAASGGTFTPLQVT